MSSITHIHSIAQQPSSGRQTVAENWHEERSRIAKLLEAVQAGEVTHIDEDDQRQLCLANPENVRLLRDRLKELDRRLGSEA